MIDTNTKIKVVLVMIPLLAIICYNFAISNTIDLYGQHKELSKNESQILNLNQRLAALSSREAQVDSILKSFSLNHNQTENNLISIFDGLKNENQVFVMDFNPPHTVDLDQGTLVTYEITLEGDFSGLLRTIFELEYNHHIGRIAHVHLQKIKDRRTRKSKLQSTLYLEEYK
ncbi:hypothetical protein [Flagellimonas allohymeniacidonis]|uniref:Uncharacterized protein n=1 Tax=Flagellimonas allohymeniacidonis TaxID=2517819 RepID=A0A4Q8QFK3_9FLAO|nr:hypothetical protein [Allomuricauda hymeniacidonis]TAI48477.1 hypothetical protein EW142_01340 [Allomuricauda hymeniacidonis]